MYVATAVELRFGVRAERASLTSVAQPVSADAAQHGR